MLTKPLAEALNKQIASEFSASNHYLAIATYFALQSLDEWAAFFFQQSDEERMHGMKILTYLIDNDAQVSRQFNDMAALATQHSDFRGLQFLQWFIEEQVEEEATMEKLVDLVTSGINLSQAQHYLPQVHAGTEAAPA